MNYFSRRSSTVAYSILCLVPPARSILRDQTVLWDRYGLSSHPRLRPGRKILYRNSFVLTKMVSRENAFSCTTLNLGVHGNA